MTSHEGNVDAYHPGGIDLVECEKELMQHRMRLLLRLRDPQIYQEFSDFMTFSKSTRFVFIMNCIMTALVFPFVILSRINPVRNRSFDTISSIEIVLAGIMCLSGWLLYYVLRWDIPIQSWKYTDSRRRKKIVLDNIQIVFYFSTLVLQCLVLLHRISAGECHDDEKLIYSWSCNPHPNSTPLDSTCILVMIPILFSAVMRESRIIISFLAWALSIGTLVAGIYLIGREDHLLFITFYVISSGVIMLDSFKQFFILFMLSHKLKSTVELNQKLADQAKAIEMRHMIANVAHDLKTPLSSFMTGVDIIANDIQDCEEKCSSSSSSSSFSGSEQFNQDDLFRKTIQGLKSTILHMKDTNTFMLMTINRCLDYAKASNGLKLNPKYETIELRDALLLPLNCMRNVQSKISIQLNPYSPDICAHVITDKQWLQENILCLLSNAVKYSAGGEATISLSLGSSCSVSSKRIPGKIIDEVQIQSPHPRSHSESEKGSVNFLFGGQTTRSRPGRTPIKRYQSTRKIAAIVADNYTSEDPTYASSSVKLNETVRPHPMEIEEDAFLMFEVADTGIGMSDEAMQSLFNPFKQTQRLAGGTGLGLYSLAKRVEALKGQYGVQRREDGHKGSVFWFTIPYKPDHLSAHLWELSHLSAKFSPDKIMDVSSSAIDIVNSRDNQEDSFFVLIAEDSPSIAKMTTVMLKKQGHKAVVAENGQVLLDLYFNSINKTTGESPYDVILMDFQMPVMDGLEATKRIRMNEQVLSDLLGKPIHQLVIGVSANSDHETVEEGLRVGIDDYLPKPFSVKSFVEKVKKFNSY